MNNFVRTNGARGPGWFNPQTGDFIAESQRYQQVVRGNRIFMRDRITGRERYLRPRVKGCCG